MKAVAYIRVSDPRQAEEDRVSLEQQETDIRAFCESRGYELVNVYRDAGHRGTSRNRPAFQAMLTDCQQNPCPFNVIICWKSDRLSRGIYPAAALDEAIQGTGITLESVKDVIDLNTFTLLAAAGKIELESMRTRFQMTRRGRAQRGQVFGHVLYGYRRGDDGRPVIVEDEAEIIQGIFKLYLEGNSGDKIASILTDEGIPAPKGGTLWHQATVTAIIRNEAYIGVNHHLKYRVHIRSGHGKDLRILNTMPEDQWVAIPFPPIIDKQTFQEAAIRRKHYKREPKGIMAQFSWPLKGMLWCGQHDKPYTTSWASGYKDREPYRYYVCSHGEKLRAKYGACRFPKIRADKAENTFTEMVSGLLFNPEPILALTKEARQEADERRSHATESIERHQQKLAELEKQRGRVLHQHRNGYVDDTYLDLVFRQIKETEQYHQEELASLEEEDNAMVGVDIEDILHLLGYRWCDTMDGRECPQCSVTFSTTDMRITKDWLTVKRYESEAMGRSINYFAIVCKYCGFERQPRIDIEGPENLLEAVGRITLMEDGRPEIKFKVTELEEFAPSNETTYRRPGLGTPPGPGRGTGDFPPPTPPGAPAPIRRW